MLDSDHIKELIALRHELHKNPELSGAEVNTADNIAKYLEQYNPDALVKNLGSNGLAAVFEGESQGAITMIRCELDALPIVEINQNIPYASSIPGVSHKCGHDGHMTMVAGLAKLLHQNRPLKGNVILLFQSAEETGQGARWIIEDPKFKDIRPNYVFALHNLPGFKKGEILLKNGTFCAASKGIKIQLHGKTSHASEPERGVSPALAVATLIPKLLDLPRRYQADFKDFVLVTLTHTQIGEKTFGVSPADAEIYLTIRAFLDDDLKSLTDKIQEAVANVQASLTTDISFYEAFDSTTNHEESVELLSNIAQDGDHQVTYLDQPNRWSEDFGLFLQQSQGAMFGLGSGTNQPALHNPDYDFPDDIIETGVDMFWRVIQTINY